jgi:hypothetical protein
MPPCHGRNPGGVIDFSSIKASPVRGHAASKVPGRSTASTPRRRGHPGPAGGRAGRGEEDPAVQDADRRRDQAQGRPDPAPSMGRRADFRLDVPLPTPSPPVRADHSARSCSAATTQHRMPPRWICSTDFSQFPGRGRGMSTRSTRELPGRHRGLPGTTRTASGQTRECRSVCYGPTGRSERKL